MLSWGVKQSFRGYVEGAGGEITTGEGAARADDGGFTFAPAPDGAALTLDADGRPTGTGAFRGEVTFKAHGGMLSVFLADPQVEISPAGAVITVADTPTRDARLSIAKLDLAAMTRGDGGALIIPAAITTDGYFLLGGHYPPGTALDPVSLTLA